MNLQNKLISIWNEVFQVGNFMNGFVSEHFDLVELITINKNNNFSRLLVDSLRL